MRLSPAFAHGVPLSAVHAALFPWMRAQTRARRRHHAHANGHGSSNGSGNANGDRDNGDADEDFTEAAGAAADDDDDDDANGPVWFETVCAHAACQATEDAWRSECEEMVLPKCATDTCLATKK